MLPAVTDQPARGRHPITGLGARSHRGRRDVAEQAAARAVVHLERWFDRASLDPDELAKARDALDDAIAVLGPVEPALIAAG
jgi:hypothetical protein